jgi:signal transduction histidine kinase
VAAEEKRIRILYMEDDFGLARLVSRRLESEGFSVAMARNGSEGIAMLDAGQYDILIVDYHMPERTGLDVIRALRDRGAPPPVIMLTGAGNERIAVDAMKLGAADYIVKDVDMGFIELLPVIIERTLKRARLDAERRQLEEELLRAKKLESIGTLAGGIAHDFNNLLAAILGNISFAKLLATSDEKVHKLLDEGEKAAVRAGDLVNQLITFSRGGAPIKAAVRLGDLLRSTARFSLMGSPARCEFDVPDDLHSVEVDEGQIRQVIHSVVQNAREAMPDGGVITITARNVTLTGDEGLPIGGGKFVKISVNDHGAGIEEENLSKIFDPYYTTKEKGSRKGMGLGLAICHSIMKAHDGLITAESAADAGTTVYLYFPVHAPKGQAAPKEVAALMTGTGRILVMDDEDAVRDIAGSMLEHLGYEATLARDGGEAISIHHEARAAGRPFDVVILDLTIPGGMGGKEAVKILLESDPNVRAIVSSGYSDDPIMSSFREHGFVAVIAKPYRLNELSDVVARTLGARR